MEKVKPGQLRVQTSVIDIMMLRALDPRVSAESLAQQAAHDQSSVITAATTILLTTQPAHDQSYIITNSINTNYKPG